LVGVEDLGPEYLGNRARHADRTLCYVGKHDDGSDVGLQLLFR